MEAWWGEGSGGGGVVARKVTEVDTWLVVAIGEEGQDMWGKR